MRSTAVRILTKLPFKGTAKLVNLTDTKCAQCLSSLHQKETPSQHVAVRKTHNEYLKKHTLDSFNAHLFTSIKQVLNTTCVLLKELSQYHFDESGKASRPKVVIRASQAFNCDAGHAEGMVLYDQYIVAMVAEMIHTASLVHDDIIDGSTMRRGSMSVFAKWGQSRGAYTGDYILAMASMTLAKLRHNQVMTIMSEILESLVKGEFMQLGTKENEDERFNHYIEKCYRKTASLFANSCKAAVLLGDSSPEKVDMAYEYGKNLGIAFQLIDDMLDYNSSEQQLGKPTAADLKLGLATAPVLFAAHEHPYLNTLIMRRFSQKGDVEEALFLVKQSTGVEQTRELARRYGYQAIKIAKQLKASGDSLALINTVENQLSRLR